MPVSARAFAALRGLAALHPVLVHVHTETLPQWLSFYLSYVALPAANA